MHVPRRAWSLAAVPTALLLAGCAAATPTSPPSVTVHVVNGISNVVLMSNDLSTAVGLHTLAPTANSFLAACGGTADVQAPVKNGNGGQLILQIDPTGALDQAVAQGDAQSSSSAYSVDIIWSTAELNAGEWVVIEPGGVARSSTRPASMPAGNCAAWIGEPSPS